MDTNQQYFTNPKSPTIARTYDATVSSTTEITLNTATSLIEVTAIGAGIFMAWGRAATNSDFDEFIGIGQTRTYVKQAATVQFIQEVATAKLVVVEK